MTGVMPYNDAHFNNTCNRRVGCTYNVGRKGNLWSLCFSAEVEQKSFASDATQLRGSSMYMVLSVMARPDIGILFINLIRLLLNARLEEFTMSNSYRISNMIHF